MNNSILRIENFVYSTKEKFLLEVDCLNIAQGETFVVIGPNGAGKTTLLLFLAGLLKTSQGTIFFKNVKLTDKSAFFEYRRKIAIVFQEPLLFNCSVFGNVASGLIFRGLNKKIVNEKVLHYLELFKISHLKDRNAKKISGGEAKRVSLARAFAVEPEILFLDEPFSSLDSHIKESIISDLENIINDTNITTIFATHDKEDAIRFSDKIVILKDGKIVQIGKPDDIINNPVNEFAASFFGIETVLKGKVEKKIEGSLIVSINGKHIEVSGNAEVGDILFLFIKPENVIVMFENQSFKTSSRNIFSGTIKKTIPMGNFVKIVLDVGFPLIAYITYHSLKEMHLKEGSQIIASFKATSINIIKTYRT